MKGVVVVCSCRQLTEMMFVYWPPIAVVTRSESIGFVATRSELLSAVEKLRSTQRFLIAVRTLTPRDPF